LKTLSQDCLLLVERGCLFVQPTELRVRLSRISTTVPLYATEVDDLTLKKREVEGLRVEYRRVQGRINYRKRRGYMFLGLLVLTLAAVIAVAVFMLSPTDWAGNQTSRFTQMTTLLLLIVVAAPLGAYFARRLDRQRERVRIASMRQREILQRLAQLDEVGDGARRRRRRRKKRSWAWRVTHPSPFTRPPLESMSTEQLEDSADALGNQLIEERGMRAIAYLHAGITGGGALILAFFVTLAGPEYLASLLGGNKWGGAVGPDPLIFWLTLTGVLVVLGGLASHRVSVLMRHARGYQDRLAAVERALWDVRVLLRERREKV
jgi:hypothetical protein